MAQDQITEYRVYINETLEEVVYDEDSAWDVIGKQPFGSRHMVRDQNGNVISEFVPF